jgi:hypothetical protein
MTLLSMLASAETVLVDGIRYNLISRAIKESGIFNLCYALWSQMYTCECFLCFLSATCHQPLELPVFKGVLGWWQMGGRWQQWVLKRY